MSHIAVFFDEPDFQDDPFDEPVWRMVYHELGAELAARGGQCSIVRTPESYRGGMTFGGGWLFKNGAFHRTEDRIEADLVYNKGTTLKLDDGARVINQPGLDAICANKRRMFELFPSLFPPTFPVTNKEELLSAVEHIPTQMVVLKPEDGFGGEGVRIVAKDQAMEEAHGYPLIAQAFIDTSGGIPGLTDTLHDFRMIIADGDILLACLRTPPDGSLLSNTALGGSIRAVRHALRPKEAERFVSIVDQTLKQFGHRLYSIDCCRDKSGKWYVLELNDQPGLMTRAECGEDADRFYGAIAGFFLSAAA